MELKDIVLKEGDIVYFDDNAKSEILINGQKPNQKELLHIIKVERPTQYETIYEAPKQILDKEEKGYLEAVIKPFRDRVLFISKHILFSNTVYEWLKINLKDEELNTEDFDLPNFKRNTMYKGMELNKEYTLEELGLFREE